MTMSAKGKRNAIICVTGVIPLRDFARNPPNLINFTELICEIRRAEVRLCSEIICIDLHV